MSDQDRPKRSSRGRLWIWLAVGVAIAWLVIGSAVGPLAGKLSEVQKNDNSSFLPASAESTLVSDEVEKFIDQNAFPLLIVVTSPDGTALTPAQLQSATTFAESIPSLPMPDGTVGQYLQPTPLKPIPSQDGMAALITVAINAEKGAERLPDGELVFKAVTTSVREAETQYTDIVLKSTGPAGIFADLVQVFGAVDSTLLLATAIVVAIILIIVYRSPFLWLIPLLSAGWALAVASAVVYFLAKADILVLNGQSQGILTVLVFGAGTDYALLMVARYREELHRFDNHVDAIKAAWRGVVEPIVASALTVCIGLMCLLISELNSNRSLGPVGAAGIIAALIVMLTLLPALLAIPSVVLPILALLVPVIIGFVITRFVDMSFAPFLLAGAALAGITVVLWVVFGIMRVLGKGPFTRTRFPAGRWAFWPKVPHMDSADEKLSGIWSRVAGGVGKRPRLVWMVTAAAMVVLAFFTMTLKADGLTTTGSFTNETESVIGQEQLAAHFAGGLGTPAYVVTNVHEAPAVMAAVKDTPGVASVVPYGVDGQPKVVDGRVLYVVTLSDAADSTQAEDTIVALRDNVHAISGADAMVGGNTAAQLDVDTASLRDRNIIIPVVLAVIFLILLILLRSIVAPLVLITTVVLSFLATLGVCALLFNHVFNFPGADTSFPLFAFVFLVALGVDYNIFLMTRVREESALIGTRPGILKGLTVTGGVITSAGIILAATFLVLGVLPLVPLREVGLAVAIGVILDTFVIRSTLVPALAYDIGRTIWWPGKLARQKESVDA